MKSKNKLLIKLFSVYYRKWLREYSSYGQGGNYGEVPCKEYYSRITVIRGWRTMTIVNRFGQVSTITPIFWWFK